jgi:hypothetical protein
MSRINRNTFRNQGMEVVGAPGMNEEKSKEYVIHNLGYVDGYGEYISKSGAHFGPEIQQKNKITKISGEEDKYSGQNNFGMYDMQSDIFKSILNKDSQKIAWGYKSKRNDIQDPTYLIFDIKIDYDNSPLFSDKPINNINYNTSNFIKSYSDSIPEIKNDNRYQIYTKFVEEIKKIFPSNYKEIDNTTGYKQHYIESVTGLDILNKKIINYPDDQITITLSEDITMSVQYMTELYNNLVYSYTSHRMIIPENLLRFNIFLVISDFRNMTDDTLGINKKVPNNNKTGINKNPSKMLYILHDCQFDFFESKNYTDELTRGGFGVSKPNTISKSSIKLNFKSISKIMIPSMIDNSMVIDLKEKIIQPSDSETVESFNKFSQIFDDTKPKDKIPLFVKDDTNQSKVLSRLKDFARGEVAQIRNVIINKLKSEVTSLSDQGQSWMNDKMGITITKVNVYYDTIKDKASMADKFVNDFIDKNIGTDKEKYRERSDISNNDPIENRNNWRNNDGNVYEDNDRNRNNLGENGTYDVGDDIDGNGDGYNEKYPDGNVYEDNDRNRNNLGENGTYDVGDDIDGNGDGYNEKYPDGNVYDEDE